MKANVRKSVPPGPPPECPEAHIGTYQTVKAHARQSRHIQDSHGTYETVNAHTRQSVPDIADSQGVYKTVSSAGPVSSECPEAHIGTCKTARANIRQSRQI